MVGCSMYEFSRVFSFMVGMSVSEYIRRRRLSQAAYDIQNGSEKIIDIALKYCYDSPASFARAFKELHGTAPAQVRKNDVPLKYCPPLKFTLSIKGVTEMNYKIVEKPAMTFVAHRIRMWNRADNPFDISALWLEEGNTPAVAYEMLDKLSDGSGYVGIYSQQYLSREDYLVAVVSDKVAPPGLINYTIPASRWVVVPAEKDALDRVLAEWMPATEYKRADRRYPVFETHEQKGKAKELWIPIESKEDTARKRKDALAELARLETAGALSETADFDLKTLKPHPECRADISYDDEGNMVMYVVPEWGDGRMGTPRTFNLPLKIEMTAKTDGRNIRIYYAGGRDNFGHGGWLMVNPNDIFFNDPSCGNEHWDDSLEYHHLPPNEFVDIEWILGERVMAVKINGELQYISTEFEYMEAMRDGETIAGPVYPATGRGSTVTVKSLRVTPLMPLKDAGV